jgi:type II secretory pathway component GspD/PulD (secretin)
MTIRVIGFLILLWMPTVAFPASVRLVDASITEILAAFSAITGDIYTSEVTIPDRLTFSRSGLENNEVTRAVLGELLEGLGLRMNEVKPGSFVIGPLLGAEKNASSSERAVRRVFIEGRIDRRGLEQLIAVDPSLVGLTVIPDGSENRTVLVSGPISLIEAIQETLDQLPKTEAPLEGVSRPRDTVLPRAGKEVDKVLTSSRFAVIDLRHADAAAVVAALGGLEQPLDGDGRITAHADKNQVIVIGSPRFVDVVSQVVDAMDRQPHQVYIDAIVAEVSEQTTRQLGIQFSGRSGDIALGLVSGTAGANLGVVAESTMLAGVTGGLVALGGAATQFPDLGILLTALQADGDTRILATPSLMAMENRDSEILVGQNVPFLTGQYATTEGGTASSPFQTIEREDLGTILRFRPRVGRDGTLMLEVTQEVSRLDTSTSGLSDVATIKRQLSTVVSAQSGETIVIGGLRDEQLETTESKVPGLGDIPIVGYLFRQESVRTVSRNLVIFLRPTLVSDQSQRIKILSRWGDGIRSQLDPSPESNNQIFRPPSVSQKMPGVLDSQATDQGREDP